MIANLRAFLHENAARALLIVLVVVIGIGFYIAAVLRFEGQYVHRHQWVSTFAAHKRELLADIYPNESVLLMAGDSTTLFGVDAEGLSLALHRPVFNYGLGAASGLGFILDETGKTARPGDTVVLMVEDRLLAGTGDVYLNDALVSILEVERFMTAPLAKQIDILLAIPWNIVINGFDTGDGQSHFDKVYTLDGFNAYGDMRSDHLTQHEPPALTQKILPAYAYSDYSLSQLVTFKQALAMRDIDLVLMPSPRLDGYLNRPAYESVFKSNQDKLRQVGLTVVGSEQGLSSIGFTLDKLYDFDTHLNPDGRAQFTGHLVDALEQPEYQVASVMPKQRCEHLMIQWMQVKSKGQEQMSDVNLLGVLRMPIECWNNSVIDQMQRHARYIEAAERIEASTKELEALRAENAELKRQMLQASSKQRHQSFVL